jgi:hypothetical protein
VLLAQQGRSSEAGGASGYGERPAGSMESLMRQRRLAALQVLDILYIETSCI